MTERPLTSTSYLVLGLVRQLQPCTAYDMKQMVNISVGMFWTFPHSQLYAEPARLVEEGHLLEEQEPGGRRRRQFRIAPSGEHALDDWLHRTDSPLGEIRDEALLRLFFADDLDASAISALADARARQHEAHAAFLESLRDKLAAATPDTQMATLALGLRWDRTAAEFWRSVADETLA